MAVSDKDRAQARVVEARRALDDDLATLTDRLPAASAIAQAGAAGGIGLALLGAAAKQLQKKLSQRSQEQALTREAEIQARAIAAAIAAAGLHGGPGQHGRQDHGPGDAPDPSSRPKVSVPVPPPTDVDGDDDGGAPWGIILLLAGLVAAVVALVRSGEDEDLWDTPGV